MSHFGSQLRSKIASHNLTYDEVGAKAGLTKGAISLICTGKQETVSRSNVSALLKSFPDPSDVIELTIAHLSDEFPEAARELVAIRPIETSYALHEPNVHVRLDAEFEGAVERIRMAVPHNEDLRLAIIDIANATCGRTVVTQTTPTIRQKPARKSARLTHEEKQ